MNKHDHCCTVVPELISIADQHVPASSEKIVHFHHHDYYFLVLLINIMSKC